MEEQAQPQSFDEGIYYLLTAMNKETEDIKKSVGVINGELGDIKTSMHSIDTRISVIEALQNQSKWLNRISVLAWLGILGTVVLKIGFGI